MARAMELSFLHLFILFIASFKCKMHASFKCNMYTSHVMGSAFSVLLNFFFLGSKK